MVWVSNQSTGTITVSITTTTNSDGHNGDYTLEPKGYENWAKNHWARSGDEIAKVAFSDGTSKEFDVGPKKFVNTYDDAVVMWDAGVIQLLNENETGPCITT